MGLTIKGNHKDSISLQGGYVMLLTIREQVALAYDKELGEHYRKMRFLIWDEDKRKWEKEENAILKNPRFKEEDNDILDFLYASNESGRLSYKTCKKVYELIKDTECDYCLRYAYYSKNDWADFKQLLLDCYSHRSSLTWN